MTDSILWRRLDLPGHEFGRLLRQEDRWELSGTAVFAYERRPCRLDYCVVCDSGWRTNSAWVYDNISRPVAGRVGHITTKGINDDNASC